MQRLDLARQFVRLAIVDKDVVSSRQPDIALAKKELGWQPTVPLAEGIVRTIEWFRSINLADYPPPSPYVMQPEAQKAG